MLITAFTREMARSTRADAVCRSCAWLGACGAAPGRTTLYNNN